MTKDKRGSGGEWEEAFAFLRAMRSVRAAPVAFFAACACSSAGARDDDGSDSVCTSLRPERPEVDPTTTSGAPMPASGGPIANGTYRLSAVTAYGNGAVSFLGCEGFAGLLELDDGRSEGAMSCYGDLDDPASFLRGTLNAGNYATSGTELTFEYRCPEGLVEVFQYSVEPPGLRMFAQVPDEPSVALEYVWTLPCDSPPCPQSGIVLGDQNVADVVTNLAIPGVMAASGADLEICWLGATSDLECTELVPERDVDNVALIRFANLTQDEVASRIASGMLDMADIDGYYEYQADELASCAMLSEFSFFGTPLDPATEFVESDAHEFLIAVTRGTAPLVGLQSMTFVTPSSSSTTLEATVPEGCGLQEVTARLSATAPVPVSAGAPWRVDWSSLRRDSRGAAFDSLRVDGLTLRFYQDTTLSELEDEAADLDARATSSWTMTVSGGRSANLADAQTTNGEAFAGFGTASTGVWLLALTCSACVPSTPVVLAVLEPVRQP